MKYFFFIVFCVTAFEISSQSITGNELLNKSIGYHDPQNVWPSFDGSFTIVSTIPGRGERVREVFLNNKKGQFTMLSSGEKSVFYSVSPFEVNVELDGRSDISDDDEKRFRANEKSAKMYRDYISYLYGLPMKLKDPGTQVHDEVEDVEFYEMSCLKMKVTYEKDVGEDIWYFYFDKESYALKAYQFFHDESIKDGEYILLNEEANIQGIKMPKIRKWYYNKDEKYLATDALKDPDE